MRVTAIGLAISSVLVFGVTSAFAYTSQANTNESSAHQGKKPISWLFVVSAGKGEVKASKLKGEYVLAMTLQDVNQVTMFSDRPDRQIKKISGKALEKAWSQGSNSFEKNPPNAVLSAANMRPIIITLTGVKAHGNQIVYQFKSIKGEALPTLKKKLTHVTLTIDSWGDCTWMGLMYSFCATKIPESFKATECNSIGYSSYCNTTPYTAPD